MRLFPSRKRKGNSRREDDSKTPLQKCWRIKNFSACKNCVGYKFLSAQKFFREYIHGVAPVSIADARKSKHAEERVASIKHSA